MNWPRGYKKTFMLNSAEYEIFLLKIVSILTFMSRKNRILGLPEPEKAEFLHILYF